MWWDVPGRGAHKNPLSSKADAQDRVVSAPVPSLSDGRTSCGVSIRARPAEKHRTQLSSLIPCRESVANSNIDLRLSVFGPQPH